MQDKNDAWQEISKSKSKVQDKNTAIKALDSWLDLRDYMVNV